MLWRIVIVLSTITFALGIFLTSVYKMASVKHSFSGPYTSPLTSVVTSIEQGKDIDYVLVYPGNVLPDHPLWPIKVTRDKLWFFLTTDPLRRAELKLLFADKRLSSSRILFEKKKPELGFSTLTKAEKYLEEASNLEKENREKGLSTSGFSNSLAKAALKHRLVIQEVLLIAPEEAKPKIIEVEEYAKNVYKLSRDTLLANGITPPKNPFERD